MNKILTSLCLTVFVFGGAARAQEKSSNEKQVLTDKAFALFQKGKLDEAIEAAERVVKLEKDSNQIDTSSYVNALVNLARMKRESFSVLQNKLRDGKTSAAERSEIAKKSAESGRDAEELFRRALALNEAGGRGRTAQTADIESDLAWLVYNYFHTGGEPSIAASRARIDEAEKFFEQSLALDEQIRGHDADETLLVVLATGNFYFNYDNIDKAFPFYERYIQTAERTHGKNYAGLVNALRPYAKISFATFAEQDAADAVKRIEEITGQKEGAPKADLNFHLRSKDSVAFNAQNFAAANDDFKNLRARAKAENRAISPNDIASLPKTERVPVRVVVDENGKIVEAVAETKDEKLRARAEREISKWTVRPFSVGAAPRRLRGYLFYTERR